MFGKPSECHLSRPAHLGMPLYRLLVCPRTETAEWMFVVWCWTQREQREKLGSEPLSRARVFERDKSVFIEWAVCKPLIVWHWSVHSATSPSITNSLPTERCLDKEKESSYFFFFCTGTPFVMPLYWGGGGAGKNWDASAVLWENRRSQEEWRGGRTPCLVWCAIV